MHTIETNSFSNFRISPRICKQLLQVLQRSTYIILLHLYTHVTFEFGQVKPMSIYMYGMYVCWTELTVNRTELEAKCTYGQFT